MLKIAVPGFGKLNLAHLVLDYNGTLSLDGLLIEGVEERLKRLAESLEIHVVTADTFGKAAGELKGLPCRLTVLIQDGQDVAKEEYVRQLGAQQVAAVGNGRNDRRMLAAAALGIAVVGPEGAAAEALAAAHVAAPSIRAALDLLLNPLRLTATLRS